MKLTIEIKCDNAAFSNDEGDPAIGPECAAILKRLASRMVDWMDAQEGGSIAAMDSNGNKVGKATFSDE